MVEAGLSYTDYAINFIERSLVSPSFISNTSSQLLETYLQWDRQWSNRWQSSLGYRGQYYSSGKQFHLNPNPNRNPDHDPNTDPNPIANSNQPKLLS